MQKIIYSALILMLCVLPAFAGGTAGKPKKKKLVVMTYNIHHCNPPSAGEKIDIPAIAAVIKKENPDFVALQEVDVNTERSGKGINQAAELAKQLGMHYFFSKGIDFQGGEYGIAILSRFAILDSFKMPLPVAPVIKGEPRTLAAVTAAVSKGQKVIFACTHLDLKPENRVSQSKLIVEHFKDEKLPVIIGGDFNAKPESDVIQYLDQHLTRSCGPDCAPTIPVDKPNRAIDFIMYKPAKAFSDVSTKVIPEKYASDHLPVVVTMMVETK